MVLLSVELSILFELDFCFENGILTGRKILLTKLLAVEDQVKDPPYTAALF